MASPELQGPELDARESDSSDPDAGLRQRLHDILRADRQIWSALQVARSLDLPDCFIASGAIYQTVWNALSGRASGYGLKDIDLIYFDGGDLSWEAEDRVIARSNAAFALSDVRIPVETRNQARVHLWYQKRFGSPYAPLRSAAESLTRYAATTHAVAVRLEENGVLTIEAPFGLEDVFSMTLRPNPKLDNKGTYDEKAARCRDLWPQVKVIPWPERHRTACEPQSSSSSSSSSSQ
ncbi:nucleotidyltransferase family protein [Denitrobaculum tricleocarpae]|uniref:nucleotidyltransferase family protein n=1 Tax=Denitrobaculum tricleocarpae TaxID=2591009 RepID=UPI001C5529BD|nr:nucleotidyltransferase family protein [Denitrobaculum tricleocarpae]